MSKVMVEEEWDDESPHELMPVDEPADYSWFDVHDEELIDDPL